MVFSHHIPDHHVGILNRAICRCPCWQPRTTGVLVWVVPGRILLIGMIRCHPEMLGDKVRTAGDTGLRMGEGNNIFASQLPTNCWPMALSDEGLVISQERAEDGSSRC